MDYSMIMQMEVIGECDLHVLSNICKHEESSPHVDLTTCSTTPETTRSLGWKSDATDDQLKRGPFATHNGYAVGVKDNVMYLYSFGLIDVLQPWTAWKVAAETHWKVRGMWNSDHSFDHRDTVEPNSY